MRRRIVVAGCVAALAATTSAAMGAEPANKAASQHVLLLSVDGIRAISRGTSRTTGTPTSPRSSPPVLTTRTRRPRSRPIPSRP